MTRQEHYAAQLRPLLDAITPTSTARPDKDRFNLARRVIVAIRSAEGTLGDPDAEYDAEAAMIVVADWCEERDLDPDEVWTAVMEYFPEVTDMSPLDKAIQQWHGDPMAYRAPGLLPEQRKFATLLIAVQDHAPEGENPFMSARQAAAITGLCPMRCNRYMKALQARGLVQIIRLGGPDRSATEYRIKNVTQ